MAHTGAPVFWKLPEMFSILPGFNVAGGLVLTLAAKAGCSVSGILNYGYVMQHTYIPIRCAYVYIYMYYYTEYVL